VQKTKFDRIYKSYSQILYNYAFWLTRNKDMSSEVIQTVFIRYWKKPVEFGHDRELEAWLFTVTRNACMDFFRKCSRFSRLRLKFMKESGKQSCDHIENNDIWQLLDDLSEKERSVLYLRFRIGHSFKEISEILDIQENTVRVCAFRALEKLREKYAEDLK